MGSFAIVTLFAVVFIAAYVEAGPAGNCPMPSKIYGCSPKCHDNYDCSHGKACCPNSCNAKSCVDLAAHGGGNNDKYSQSGGAGVYCANQKCSPFEKCKLDPATKRMKCMRA
ncbi:WAP, Kazal, immunoglobulin, Kunitz and NTR domain-containing protein [Pieris napi]|uniref:WAP, Kazal, immunoglobulin, Kunitz and NTR domain-containing protein n=1 Tax=Pieris napi TaxID=78633 RepID=UPI001FB89ACA|nr:WAP, Kazal, immunoglobulin, Kunitz and NTR domain-containing protein [Pieris napi]